MIDCFTDGMTDDETAEIIEVDYEIFKQYLEISPAKKKFIDIQLKKNMEPTEIAKKTKIDLPKILFYVQTKGGTEQPKITPGETPSENIHTELKVYQPDP